MDTNNDLTNEQLEADMRNDPGLADLPLCSVAIVTNTSNNIMLYLNTPRTISNFVRQFEKHNQTDFKLIGITGDNKVTEYGCCTKFGLGVIFNPERNVYEFVFKPDAPIILC